MLTITIMLLLGLEGLLAGEILSYNEPQHSRTEAGVPGTNVTGKWSWVDRRGQKHHIWYVADTRGFRAFGDLVPDDPQTPASSFKIGTPVIGGSVVPSTARANDALAKNIPALLPERKTLSVGTPALGGPRITSETRDTNHFSFPTFTNSHVQKRLPVQNEFISDSSPQAATVGFPFQDVPRIPQKNSRVVTQASVTEQTANTLTNIENAQRAFPISSNSQSLSELAQQQTRRKDESGNRDIIVESISNPIEPQRILGKAVRPFPLISEGKINSGHFSTNNNQNLRETKMPPLEALLPAPSAGSDFVLIDRLRPPTIPKPRVGSTQIVPKPVNVQTSASRVIMGLHTSGKPPMSHRLRQPSRNLTPLGIHLLNPVANRSNRGKSNSLSSTGPVPRPSRIIGAPNLENFYRPATLARTTPSPFRLPSPSRDYDYQYYDYDYYDYANYDSGTTLTETDTSSTRDPRKTKPTAKSVKDVSDENDNSAESESGDSDESDD